MIKRENIKIKICSKNLSFYKKIKYEIKVGDIIEISSLDLQNGSSVKITGICDYCGKEKKLLKKHIKHKLSIIKNLLALKNVLY